MDWMGNRATASGVLKVLGGIGISAEASGGDALARMHLSCLAGAAELG
jgi:hypothetical protein